MVAQGDGGAIVSTSSVHGRRAWKTDTAYGAAKAGVLRLTESMAVDLGEYGIRCNAILPGLIDNERGRAILARKAESEGKSLKETEKEYLKFISMRCWIEPKEVGDLAVFLSSERAKHISGQFIAVDWHIECDA